MTRLRGRPDLLTGWFTQFIQFRDITRIDISGSVFLGFWICRLRFVKRPAITRLHEGVAGAEARYLSTTRCDCMRIDCTFSEPMVVVRLLGCRIRRRRVGVMMDVQRLRSIFRDLLSNLQGE
ncbi:hypothetical protein ACFX15_007638 [Malus domestica]